jgi:hypothetical protein
MAGDEKTGREESAVMKSPRHDGVDHHSAAERAARVRGPPARDQQCESTVAG